MKLFQARSSDSEGKPLSVDGVVGTHDLVGAVRDAGCRAAHPARPLEALLQRVIDVAASEEQQHVREEPLGSNRGPRVDQYLRAAGIDPNTGSYPWCAGFIVWCFDNAARELGLASPVPRTAGVHDMWQKAGRAGFRRIPMKWRLGIRVRCSLATCSSSTPERGTGTPASSWPQGNDFQTIEGNTNELGGREGDRRLCPQPSRATSDVGVCRIFGALMRSPAHVAGMP